MKEVNSYTLYPSMMQKTKLLIIDYDVTRYHSFDLLRYELLNREMFIKLLPEFIPIITSTEMIDQVDCYRHSATTVNPLDCFNLPKCNMEKLEQIMCEMLSNKISKITPTDLDNRFDIVFERPGVTGVLLQYQNDTHKPSFYDKVTVYRSECLLNPYTAIDIIKRENINSVMVSSIDLAVLISMKLVEQGYKSPISYIVANYHYNYEGEGLKNMKHYKEMCQLEYDYKNEFGIFDPYSGISYRNKLKNNKEEPEV